MEVTYEGAQESAHAMMPSTTVLLDGTTSQPECSITPARDQSQQKNRSIRSKLIKTKTSYPIQLGTVCPCLLLLATCVFYLSTAIIVVSIGLINISNFIYVRYDRAVDEFRAQSTTLYTEQILHDRLDKLLSSQLGRGFLDTHENCLVRGLEKADYELLGLGFQYPNIRMQVMDWTFENCGRLQHTPQVVVKDPTPQQAVLTYWADFSHRSRRTLEKALGFMRQQTGRIWARFLGAVSTANAFAPTEDAPGSSDTMEPRYYRRLLPKVPFGFALRCESSQPCRLFYPFTSVPSDKASISPEALAKLKLQSEELHAFYANINKVLSATRYLLSLLICVGLLMMLSAVAHATPTKAGMRSPGAHSKWGKEHMYAFTSAITSLVMGLLRYLFMVYPRALPYDSPFGLAMLLLGVSMLVQFFIVRISKPLNVVHAYELIKELYLIVRGWEIDPKTLDETHTQVENPEHKTTEDSPTDMETDPSSSGHYQHLQSTKQHHRLVSPANSLQEDIKTYTKALCERHNAQQIVEYHVDSDIHSDIDTESDTEPDNEDNGFVDLAGGVTPQLTDVGSGWSTVDA
ncbi:uncharacterized protein ALTATR162_LOCUS6754 [Alternaria atra]|uniref:Uncharacterized protein n=1 Tax=Alternaria atra TaxID=119953 RepID=A0A8J2I3Z9_9PLEO|nr:uncharacterized protein ALTATR162_LOCUS6754 [Alternaria atra]CAG5165155.1 unnamed protein product [Alternaria atra]